MNGNKPTRGARARDWWRDLQNNPGDRAALRRTSNLPEVPLIPAALDLMLRLGWRRVSDAERDWYAERVAVVALVLATVHEDRKEPVARQIGIPQGRDGNPIVSEVRLRRLLTAEDSNELLQEALALVRLAGGSVNVADLATSLLDWSNPRRNVRQRWLYDYHGIAVSNTDKT